MSELRPGDRLDQYLLEDIIARSGMATIFRARDTENDQRVALKVPYLQYESDLVFHERFLREEQIGLRLHHPAIIKVFRPKEKSRVYLAMEYIEGELLSVRLHREGRLPIATALDFAVQTADALVYLHSQNVVHRDLKPENIMILAGGKLKLMDFGIALDASLRKITWSGLSQTMGTPDYMAPEQVKGRRGDAHTDIYSLGVILYEMVTGQVPFTGENVYAAMRAKVHDDPVAPRKLRPDLSPQLEEIILHALERAPKDRFESAIAFLEALTHPEGVTLTDRAARQRPKSKGMPWLRTLLTFITGKRQ
ncbi:MAG TPA: serine/threonine-protein kinase [Candidatus Manganitrophaceae bacterium]|nr:serine/threonine-protein kinase [Candidatus Manganitrophaceae bacterium]